VSLIIDAIKRAQQLRMKEFKGVPFFREYSPKGKDGGPRRKSFILLSILGSGILLVVLLLLGGELFPSFFIPSHEQNVALIEKGRPARSPEMGTNIQSVPAEEFQPIQIGKELSPEAFFIDVVPSIRESKGGGLPSTDVARPSPPGPPSHQLRVPAEKSLPSAAEEIREKKPGSKKKPGNRKKKPVVSTEGGNERSELSQIPSADLLSVRKEPPSVEGSVEAKEESVTDPLERKGKKKKTDLLGDKASEKRETSPLPITELMVQKTSSSSLKQEVSARPLSTKKEIEKRAPLVSDVIIHFNLGVESYHRREISKAVQAYQKAVEIDPNYIEAYNNLGVIYQELGNFDKALQAYQKALEINPRYEKTLNNLGILFFLSERYEQSIEAFEKALAINPDNVESHINLGILFKKRGQVDRAIESYQKALTINPLNGETHYNIGLLYEQMGRRDLAVQHFQTFIQLSSKTHPDLVAKVQRHLNYLATTRKDEKE
jgi:Tfp pilus assembly protein PilF